VPILPCKLPHAKHIKMQHIFFGRLWVAHCGWL